MLRFSRKKRFFFEAQPLKKIYFTLGIRQERPPHLRPDGIHPAMRERGRAIPVMPTVPITGGERPHHVPPIAPKIIDGRVSEILILVFIILIHENLEVIVKKILSTKNSQFFYF